LFEFGEAALDGGVRNTEGGFHVADAAFAEDEDAEEVEVVVGEGGELVGGEGAPDGQVAVGAMEFRGEEGPLAGGAANLGADNHGGTIPRFRDDARRIIKNFNFQMKIVNFKCQKHADVPFVREVPPFGIGRGKGRGRGKQRGKMLKNALCSAKDAEGLG
jgi:hypothetical protein